MHSYLEVHQMLQKSTCKLEIQKESKGRKSSNKANRQAHAFSSWFLVSVVSHKPMISKQPTLLRKMFKISVIIEGKINSQKGKKKWKRKQMLDSITNHTSQET